MGRLEEKVFRFIISFLVLAFLISIIPELGNCIGLNSILGYTLGMIYVKDRNGRYHYTLDGKYVFREESLCLECLLPMIGDSLPAAIPWLSLPIYALGEAIAATFGPELVGIFGGFSLFE